MRNFAAATVLAVAAVLALSAVLAVSVVGEVEALGLLAGRATLELAELRSARRRSNTSGHHRCG